MIEQFALNSLLAAALYSLVASSFYLSFVVWRRLDLSIAALIALAPHVAMTLQPLVGMPAAIGLAVFIAAAVAAVLARFLFAKPSVDLQAEDDISDLLVSFGLLIVVQGCLAVLMGNDRKVLRVWDVAEGFVIGNARVTPSQLTLLASSALVAIFMWAIIQRTPTGIAWRAVRTSPLLVASLGLSLVKLRMVAALTLGAIAGLTGVLIGMDRGFTPTMGLQPLLMGITAVILGGSEFAGILLGALALAALQGLSFFFLSSGWQDLVTFGVLAGALILRPRGLVDFAKRPG